MAMTPIQADLLLDCYVEREADPKRLRYLVENALAHGVSEEQIYCALNPEKAGVECAS